VTGPGIWIAVLAALGAACSFGIGVALQHRQAQLEHGTAPLRLLGRLARRRRWLAGIALAVGAYGLQALALAFGPLALVAPLVATDLLFALPVAAMWERRRMRGRDWAGCALVGGSVAVFLLCAPAAVAGHGQAAAGDWLLAAAVTGLIAAAAVTAAALSRATARAALLAVAVGVIFGMTAAVTLSMSRLLREDGFGAALAHWQPWALLVLGVTGLVLSAAAYQAGALRASLPIMDTLEPVSGVLIGAAVFGEQLATSPAGLSLQLAAAAGAITGIVMLARSPLAADSRRTEPASVTGAQQDRAASPAGRPARIPADGNLGQVHPGGGMVQRKHDDLPVK
jgi:drug/metabolite transporter (DMT)-like permease